jgi:hypothetical protein
MATKMEIAFVTSPSVTMKTPLGRKILEIAGRHARFERERLIKNIHRIEANKAAERAIEMKAADHA